jgi:hypothetical protein
LTIGGWLRDCALERPMSLTEMDEMHEDIGELERRVATLERVILLRAGLVGAPSTHLALPGEPPAAPPPGE